jgi:BirA family transcriptional regulator, biotin operon repressor / biotin---[acetyl-CoA-carboxylase] ligase
VLPQDRSSDGKDPVLIRSVPETASTNDDVAALAREGAPEGLWLRADHQTGGRGRQGREWLPGPGNLYASTIIRLQPGDPPAESISLVAAVALQEVVQAFAGEADIRIKWPNDLLSGGSKLSGILLERFDDVVIVGVGVNLADFPEETLRPSTSLRNLTGTAPDPQQFLEMLAAAFADWLSRWRSEGVGPVRTRWLDRALPIGTALSTAIASGTWIEGLFDGLDSSGALKLRLPDGTQRVIHAGDVFLI